MVEDKDTVELWWDAVRSDSLLANGLPHIPCTSSQEHPPHPPLADADVAIDERPWKPQGSGIDIGEAGAEACLGG
jgi:hypothetical protein